MKYSIKQLPTCLTMVTLMAVGVAIMPPDATAQALQGRVVVRPLTPQELKDPTLVGNQGASGLSTVGVGQPAYLEALVNSAIAPSNIVGVDWQLTAKPMGSAAALTSSPLGPNIPPYEMITRPDSQIEGYSAQVAGRTVLRPDVVGQYTVSATITTTSSGTANLTQNITASTYLGNDTCGYCHGGGPLAPDKYEGWLETRHASMFTRHIDGLDGGYPRESCITCHTVGYDANTNAVNGGFDDVAKRLGWTFPAERTNGNWAAMPHALKVVANIGCENCHGAGSEHALAALLEGDPEIAKQRISKSFSPGNCAQCHDSLSHHFRSAEWSNSRHAIGVEETRSSCGRCHTAQGFADYAAGAPAVETPYEVITCAACHDPHDATNPHQLRKVSPVTLFDEKTTITEGGLGLLCMNCHVSRRDATNYVETSNWSSHFGPHHGPQTDMFVGANAMTYGQDIPSSAHRHVVEEACVTCHMQEAEESPAFTHAGGHTFSMKWDSGAGTIEMTEACVECHGEIEGFDFKRQDYDGDGVVEGVQTEVKGLLDQLGMLLPPIGDPAVVSAPSYTRQQLRAYYNYEFVLEDGSFGIHNLSYAVGVLKASIADLSGDANKDSLPDWWQNQYYGSFTHPDAAPNACPLGDGVPNWLKYALGLDPTIPGMVLPDGVVWANGKALEGAPADTIRIYTAAEVVFDTEVGKSYQIQAVSSMSGGWQDLGPAIPGTGTAISYVTPTRENLQQFYRVVEMP